MVMIHCNSSNETKRACDHVRERVLCKSHINHQLLTRSLLYKLKYVYASENQIATAVSDFFIDGFKISWTKHVTNKNMTHLFDKRSWLGPKTN